VRSGSEAAGGKPRLSRAGMRRGTQVGSYWLDDLEGLRAREQELMLDLEWGRPEIWEEVDADWRPLAGTDPRTRTRGGKRYGVVLSKPLAYRGPVEDALKMIRQRIRELEKQKEARSNAAG
jgi:hypothetical protein